jgi:hypothetical protein
MFFAAIATGNCTDSRIFMSEIFISRYSAPKGVVFTPIVE